MPGNNEHNHGSSSITRRDFLSRAGAATALVGCGVAGILESPLFAATLKKSSLGEWLEDENGLPCFHYTGPLSFQVKMKNGGLVPTKTMAKGYSRPYLPDDPYFLLGNYRLTLFVHASGLYQILTGERAWGRMNQGDSSFSGANQTTVEIEDQQYELVGMDAPAAAGSRCKIRCSSMANKQRILTLTDWQTKYLAGDPVNPDRDASRREKIPGFTQAVAVCKSHTRLSGG